MKDIFRPYIGKFVLAYMDDILVFSKSPEHLRLVLQCLRERRTWGVHSISLSLNFWVISL